MGRVSRVGGAPSSKDAEKRSVGPISRTTRTPAQVISHSRNLCHRVYGRGWADVSLETGDVVAALTPVLYPPVLWSGHSCPPPLFRHLWRELFRNSVRGGVPLTMWRCDVAGFKSRSPVIAAQQRVMKITIDKDGSVYKAEGVSGPPELVPAAVEAVKQWKYQPYVLNGEAVEVETTAEITFTQ